MTTDAKTRQLQRAMALFRREVFDPLSEAFHKYELRYFWDGELPERRLGRGILGTYRHDGTIVIRPPKPSPFTNSDCWLMVLMTVIHETAHGVLITENTGRDYKKLYAEAEARLAEVIAYEKMAVRIDAEYFWYDYQRWMKDYEDTCSEQGRKVFLPRHEIVGAIVDAIIDALPEKFRRPSCGTFCPSYNSCKLPRRCYTTTTELQQLSLFSGLLLGDLRESLSADRASTKADAEQDTSDSGKPKRSKTEISHHLLWQQSELLAALNDQKRGSAAGYACLQRATRLSALFLEWVEAEDTSYDTDSGDVVFDEILDIVTHCFSALTAAFGKRTTRTPEEHMPLGLLLENEVPGILTLISQLLSHLQKNATAYFKRQGLSADEAKSRLENDIGNLPTHFLTAAKAGPYWQENPEIVRDIAIILDEAVSASVVATN